jgi:hypothetical protein
MRRSPEEDALLGTLRSDLAEAGEPLVLCPVDGPLGDSLFLELLLDGRLGALVVTATHSADPALADITRTGHAVVAVDDGPAAPGMILAALGIGRPAERARISVSPGPSCPGDTA